MLLFALLLIPLAGALVAVFLRGRAADVVAAVAMTLALGVLLWVASTGAVGGFVDQVGTAGLTVLAPDGWPWVPGAVCGLRLDALGALMALVVLVVGLGITVYSAGYFSDRNRDHPGAEGKGRYYFFLLLFVTAMLGIALAPDFFMLFLFWELTTICSWALISHYQTREAAGAGLKALAVTQFASLFLVGGLLVLYRATGSFAFDAAGRLAPGALAGFAVLLLVAAWGKAAQVPFFTWLPSAMAAPTPASAFLHAAAMVKAGVFLTARVLVTAGALSGWPALLAGGAALVTLYAGLAGYFYQDDLKRLLAYSTICNLALMLFGLALGALGAAEGTEGALLHLWSHAFTKGLLFLAVGAIAYGTGSRSIETLSGLTARMPLAAAAFLAGALAISGLPPFGIFWSKLLILRGALAFGGGWGWAAVALVLVESGFSLAWFLHVAHRILFGRPSAAVQTAHGPSLSMGGVLTALIALTLAAPYLGMPVVRLIVRG